MTPLMRRLFSLPASMFYCLMVLGLHERIGFPNGAPAAAALLAKVFLASSIALWTLSDARHRQQQIPYDFGSFAFFAWPVLTPVYLFQTRGWRGFTTLGWFLLIYLAASVVSNITPLLTWHRS